jgi:hypothetical protein
VRLLPVATSVAIASVLGTRFVVRLGNKAVVTTGLTLLSVAYVWISSLSLDTAYLEIAGQMVVLGLGMGFTSAPATESIMGAVSVHRAGMGSAVNDATRELGGTLGVAVIGSVYASLYGDAFARASSLPGEAVEAARESIGAATVAAQQLSADGSGEAAQALTAAASSGFLDGLQAGCLVAAGALRGGGALRRRRAALPAGRGARARRGRSYRGRMSARTYGQHCGVAHALDLLGERWTMLVLRELMLGPSATATCSTACPWAPTCSPPASSRSRPPGSSSARRCPPPPGWRPTR